MRHARPRACSTFAAMNGMMVSNAYKATSQSVFGRLFGGAEGNRTPDLYIANVALSQLSYSRDQRRKRFQTLNPATIAGAIRRTKGFLDLVWQSVPAQCRIP